MTECLLLAGVLESIEERVSFVVFGNCFRLFYLGIGTCFFVSGLIG